MRAWRGMLARLAYGTLMRLLLPLLWLRLLWRARAEPLYGRWMGERFARYSGVSSGARVWVHAVSLGETRAAEPLLQALRAQRPGVRLLLTHGTATGREAGRALLGSGDRQCWLPLDTPGAARRFFHHHRPLLGVLMETEVWPNLLHEARRAGVPVVLANARLSAKSLRQAQRFGALLRPAVQGLAACLAQTEADAQRLRAAGARRVTVCGNLKFDMTPAPELLALGRQWRGTLARPVVLAAVWREGEDEGLLEAWRALPPAGRALLVVVPRHPQRFDAVAALIEAAGLRLSRRSGWDGGLPTREDAQADVWLGDSMREMPAYYALADVALLGGSFAPLGGQNLIEAAACGCVVVAGPHTFNFAEATAMAEAAGAAVRAPDLAAGVRQALALIEGPELPERRQRAADFAAAHRGAAERMAQHLAALLEVRAPAGR